MTVTPEQKLTDEMVVKAKKKKQVEAYTKHKLDSLKLKLRDLNKKLQVDLNKIVIKFNRDEDHQNVLLGTIAAQELVKIAKRLKILIATETNNLNVLKRKNNS